MNPDPPVTRTRASDMFELKSGGESSTGSCYESWLHDTGGATTPAAAGLISG